VIRGLQTRRRVIAATFCLLAGLLGGPVAHATATATQLIDAGRFSEAGKLITTLVSRDETNADVRRDLEFQRERMRRILLDFSLDVRQVETSVRKQIPDLHDEEFARWNSQGLFERRKIDGRTLYFNRSPSNLFRLSAEARARRAVKKPFADGPLEVPHPHHREVRDAALASGTRFVAPRAVRVTQSITVEADAVPAGKMVKAWIPFPRAIPGQQEAIRLLSSKPAAARVAPENALQRTAYLEAPAVAGQPTHFEITYQLTVRGQYTAVDPAKVLRPADAVAFAPFVGERPPHIVFTKAMQEFSRSVVGDEKNPYMVARKLFAAVDRIPWAGALEYSTISNISDYALHAGHADCGQQTLLLMTLLRLNGIPARWQSGMVYSEGEYSNLHDWGQFYIEPYGWLPMDVTFGVLRDPDPQIAWFYLGGLDAYRIAFNDDYGRDFIPAKQHFRSETVDLQRGEVEWDGGNLYFNQWDYDFAWQVLPGVRDTTANATLGEKP
jgi:transglutaminase-like putative cysteine protease